jgi:hypothetical protein
MKRSTGCIFLFALVAAAPVLPQGLRTGVASVVTVFPASPEGVTVTLRYNQAVAVNFPTDSLFIQGLEFELRIPKAVQGAESSIAWSLYSKVSPPPSMDRVDYDASLIATQPLPSRVSVNLILPVIERHGIKSGPFAGLIPSVAGPDKFPLMFKLTPIGKGLSPSVESADFKLTVRPVLRDEGAISIKVAFPEGADRPDSVVYVDDKRIEDNPAMVLAKKGARVVRVSAEGYKEEVLTVAVEAGRIVTVAIELVPSAPVFSFQAPAGTFVSIDGQAVPASEMNNYPVEPGEHTLFFRIGDYSMTRKVMALRGKTYKLVLSVELDIVSTP